MDVFTGKEETEEHRVADATVIIAVRNGAKTIERALESLNGQTVVPQKIIIVDDYSTDDTVEVVNNFAGRNGIAFEDMPVLTLSHNHWIYTARNIGAKEVKTKYMCFLDADDYFREDYIEKTVALLEEEEHIDFAYCQMMYFNNEGSQLMDVPEYGLGDLLVRNYCAYSSMMRTEVFQKMGGYSEFLNDYRSHMTEWDLWLRMAKEEHYGMKISQPMFCYQISKDQMSKNQERGRTDQFFQMVTRLDDSLALGEYNENTLLLVCQGKDYIDKTKVGFEVYTWQKALEEQGEVFCFFYDVEEAYYGNNLMRRNLKDLINRIKPDYIFHPAYKNHIPVEDWKEYSKEYKTIVWFSDDDRRYEEHSKIYATGFRTVMTTYKEAFDKHVNYLSQQRHVVVLSQWAVCLSYFDSIQSASFLAGEMEKDLCFSFYGQRYGDREAFIDYLIEMVVQEDYRKKVPFDIQGGGWGSNSFLDYPEMIKRLQRSKVSLNFSKGWRPEGGVHYQTKLRVFEICAAGACCLTEYSPGLEDWFQFAIDSEVDATDDIVIFRSKEELVEKMNLLLNNEELRKAIAKNGYNKVASKHLWKHRFREVIKSKWKYNERAGFGTANGTLPLSDKGFVPGVL